MSTNSPSSVEPPKQPIYWQQALVWHGLGFLTIIVLTWLDSVLGLMDSWRGRTPEEFDFMEVSIKTGILMFIWLLSAYKLYLLVSRLSYLENFLIVCAWCRRIEREGTWLSLEEHFNRQTGAHVSHGCCPECQARVQRQGKR